MKQTVGRTIRSARPFGSSEWRMARAFSLGYSEAVLLEIGIVVLSVVCFVLLDLYVIGCERV
ncbi:MAG TPA: hypothetical protein VGX91_01465 [Candidatus Cybelea sp.]|nr:hypothetical protein [Candidatus Cybelea sp.]